MKKILLLVLIVVLVLAFLYWKKPLRTSEISNKISGNHHTDSIQTGDIIFQTSRSTQSKAIQLATHSKYSHMGIVYRTGGEYYVFEAIQPVTMTKLSDWIKRGENSHYVVKRLKDEKLLTQANLEKLLNAGERFRGKSYDAYFEWSDDRIYCSELVWKIYKDALHVELGSLQELRDFDLTSEVVKSQLEKRYGDHIPFEEKVISPAAIFNSDKLAIVTTSGTLGF